MLVIWLCIWIESVEAPVRLHIWEVKQAMIGSYREQVITINGEHPGPTIQAHQGETVFVRVTNKLGEDVAIHWHNTQEIQTRPISPGKTFTYVFIVHQLGKSQYDSYYTMQTVAGLHGLIDVLPPYGGG